MCFLRRASVENTAAICLLLKCNSFHENDKCMKKRTDIEGIWIDIPDEFSHNTTNFSDQKSIR